MNLAAPAVVVMELEDKCCKSVNSMRMVAMEQLRTMDC